MLTSRLRHWMCWGSLWSPACYWGWPSAGSLCSLQSGTGTCRAETLCTAWTPNKKKKMNKVQYDILYKFIILVSVSFQSEKSECVTPSLCTAHHHFLVESIVQHQTVSQRQTVRLHGVASTWQRQTAPTLQYSYLTNAFIVNQSDFNGNQYWNESEFHKHTEETTK